MMMMMMMMLMMMVMMMRMTRMTRMRAQVSVLLREIRRDGYALAGFAVTDSIRHAP
jgi:hypothetical protein